jgi:hypothetical protein
VAEQVGRGEGACSRRVCVWGEGGGAVPGPCAHACGPDERQSQHGLGRAAAPHAGPRTSCATGRAAGVREDAPVGAAAAQVLRHQRSGVALSDVALLYRTNFTHRPFAEALAAAGLPYKVVRRPADCRWMAAAGCCRLLGVLAFAMARCTILHSKGDWRWLAAAGCLPMACDCGPLLADCWLAGPCRSAARSCGTAWRCATSWPTCAWWSTPVSRALKPWEAAGAALPDLHWCCSTVLWPLLLLKA